MTHFLWWCVTWFIVLISPLLYVKYISSSRLPCLLSQFCIYCLCCGVAGSIDRSLWFKCWICVDELDSVESCVDVGNTDMDVCRVSYILLDLTWCRCVALTGMQRVTVMDRLDVLRYDEISRHEHHDSTVAQKGHEVLVFLVNLAVLAEPGDV
jgi:hypothetical protein